MTIAISRIARAGRAGSSGRISWALWGLSGTAAAVVLGALRAGVVGLPHDQVCLLRRLAHVSCPTCGLTRSIAQLVRGDLAESITLHPWGVALVVQLAAAWVVWGLWNARRLRSRPDRHLPRLVAANAVALAVLWVVRLATGTLP